MYSFSYTQEHHVGSFKSAKGEALTLWKTRKNTNQDIFSPESWLLNIYQQIIAKL